MSRSRPNPRAACALLVMLIGWTAGACLYDPTQRCGPAMTYSEPLNGCACDDHAIQVVGGCQVCAEDEVALGGICGCPAGQTKNATNVCVVIAGLGDPCDTVTSPCNDATYSYCDTRPGSTAGTCTNHCTGNSDCGAVYTCATWEAMPYCRQFVGAGKVCATSADCGDDATFCDTSFTLTCFVAGCSLTANDCPRDNLCCDYTAYGLGTLCGPACL